MAPSDQTAGPVPTTTGTLGTDAPLSVASAPSG